MSQDKPEGLTLEEELNQRAADPESGVRKVDAELWFPKTEDEFFARAQSVSDAVDRAFADESGDQEELPEDEARFFDKPDEEEAESFSEDQLQDMIGFADDDEIPECDDAPTPVQLEMTEGDAVNIDGGSSESHKEDESPSDRDVIELNVDEAAYVEKDEHPFDGDDLKLAENVSEQASEVEQEDVFFIPVPKANDEEDSDGEDAISSPNEDSEVIPDNEGTIEDRSAGLFDEPISGEADLFADDGDESMDADFKEFVEEFENGEDDAFDDGGATDMVVYADVEEPEIIDEPKGRRVPLKKAVLSTIIGVLAAGVIAGGSVYAFQKMGEAKRLEAATSEYKVQIAQLEAANDQMEKEIGQLRDEKESLKGTLQEISDLALKAISDVSPLEQGSEDNANVNAGNGYSGNANSAGVISSNDDYSAAINNNDNGNHSSNYSSNIQVANRNEDSNRENGNILGNENYNVADEDDEKWSDEQDKARNEHGEGE